MSTALEIRALLERADVDFATGCMNWRGSKTPKGYPMTRVNNRTVYAHRRIAELNGRNIAGRDVCHRCDNPSCINPDHLFVGTRKDNMRDAANKGRLGGATGENARKTHCKSGHELSPENTYQGANYSGRACVACARAASSARYRAKKYGAARKAAAA